MGIHAQLVASKRASIENPSTSLSNPDEWLFNAWGAAATAAGPRVNPDTAMRFAVVWACVNVLAQDISKLPLITYERQERGKSTAMGHPAYMVLKERANREMSAQKLRLTMQAHVVTWGNAYAEMELDGRGQLVGLWPLLPDRTRAERIDGQKWILTRVRGEEVMVPGDRVLHVAGLGFDGLRGYPVIQMARETIAAGMAAELYGASFFGNGARPGGVITRPDTLPEEALERIRRSFEAVHGGLTNAQRVAILDEGMEYQEIGVPPEDAQFIATRQFSVEEITRWFRVPPHKIQHLLRSTFSNEESQERSYVRDALQFWLVNWEQEIGRTVFARQPGRFFARHNVDSLLRGDTAARKDYFQAAIQYGWMSPNDVRELEDMNPIEGGDVYFVPLNLVPLEFAAEPPPQIGAPPDDGGGGMSEGDEEEEQEENAAPTAREVRSAQQRHKLMRSNVKPFRAAVRRVLAAERPEVERILADTLERSDRSVADFLADLALFYERFEEDVRSTFAAVVDAYSRAIRRVVAAETGYTKEPDLDYEAFTREYSRRMATRYTRWSYAQLQYVVQNAEPGEVVDDVTERLDGWDDKRPTKVAGNETVRAMGALSKAAYMGAGLLTIVWRAVGTDTCPYCKQLDGRVAGVREAFMTPGDTLDDEVDGQFTTHQTIGHPPLHAGCDCLITGGS